jgi:hypothetical protein
MQVELNGKIIKMNIYLSTGFLNNIAIKKLFVHHITSHMNLK